MERPDVFMPLYIGDYLAGTSRLTTEQHGAYLLLIMDYWMNGPMPDDDAVLASICKCSSDAWSIHRALLEKFFSIENGEWKHKRIEQELEKARSKKQVAKAKAEAAAAARWKNKQNAGDECLPNAPSNAPSNPHELLKECPSPSPSPSPSEINTTTANAVVCSEPSVSKPPADSSPVFIFIPTNKFNTSGEQHPVTENQIQGWAVAYPAVDVRRVLAQIRSWSTNNPAKRKTVKGMNRFIDSWLAREQNNGGSNHAASQQHRGAGAGPAKVPHADTVRGQAQRAFERINGIHGSGTVRENGGVIPQQGEGGRVIDLHE